MWLIECRSSRAALHRGRCGLFAVQGARVLYVGRAQSKSERQNELKKIFSEKGGQAGTLQVRSSAALAIPSPRLAVHFALPCLLLKNAFLRSFARCLR